VSIAIIAVTFALWWRVCDRPVINSAVVLQRCAGALGILTVSVLVVGTVVTGSGPHAGDAKTPRNGLAPAAMSQLHADVVMLLIGATIGFALLARAAGASIRLQRAVRILLVVELSQGLVGFVQYFTHVPVALVGVHMFGACLVWLAALLVLAEAGVIRQPT
jgi:cytochrome c oxidase assembly protein subunit 15